MSQGMGTGNAAREPGDLVKVHREIQAASGRLGGLIEVLSGHMQTIGRPGVPPLVGLAPVPVQSVITQAGQVSSVRAGILGDCDRDLKELHTRIDRLETLKEQLGSII